MSSRLSHRRRTAGIVLSVTSLTTALTAALPAAPVVAAAVTEWTSSPADWQQDFSPWGRSTSGTTTVDSEPATRAESAGVVLIDTVIGSTGSGAGTGLVLTSGGEVLTNYHVVEGATSVQVTVATTGRTYAASVLGHDETEDIALLQLKDATGLTSVRIDDDTVARGDEVTAVGNAGGTSTLTAADGTVTALDDSVTTSDELGGDGETLDGLIETDADVVPGDSGGPLLDDEGEVVGIDTAASTGEEINGYAIPIEDALAVVQQIRSGEETGTVEVGAGAFLGVELGSSTHQGYGSRGWDGGWDEQAAGATLGGVVDGGPAAAAGLEAGDTLTAIGGTAITGADQVPTLLQTYDEGDRVRITWTDAQGEQHSATVTLAANPAA